MPKFKVSQKAEDDLMEIGIYTENKWGVDQRDLYLDDIEKSFNLLAKDPDYPTSKNIDHIVLDCFSLLVNEHVIIYKKFSYGIRVIRVLSQKMNFERHL